MKRRKNEGGLSLAEIILASAIASIVLTAVYTLFASGFTVRWHLEGELRRNKNIALIMKEIGMYTREANLAYATFIYADAEEGAPQDSLTAIALPSARDVKTDLFITDENDGLPVWQCLHIYYLAANNTDLMMIGLAPNSPDTFDPHRKGRFVLPLPSGDIQSYCETGGSSASGYALVDGPRVIARDIEWFGPQINRTDFVTLDGENSSRYSLTLNLRLFYTERGSDEKIRMTLQRVLYSDNSMYQLPGPLHTPIPTPIPPYPPPSQCSFLLEILGHGGGGAS